MDYKKPLDLLHAAEEAKWVDWVNLARAEESIFKWVTGFNFQSHLFICIFWRDISGTREAEEPAYPIIKGKLLANIV